MLPAGRGPRAGGVALVMGKGQKVLAALTGLVKKASSSMVRAGEPRLTEISGLELRLFSLTSSQAVALGQFGL